MSYTEWELLEISEQLEPGDFISVEEDDGQITKCIYVKNTGKFLHLKDISTKEIRKFNTESLEEIEGSGCVVGRCDD